MCQRDRFIFIGCLPEKLSQGTWRPVGVNARELPNNSDVTGFYGIGGEKFRKTLTERRRVDRHDKKRTIVCWGGENAKAGS